MTGQSKKMVMFSPSLERPNKVIKYTNPFKNGGPSKINNSLSKDNLRNSSNSFSCQKKINNDKSLSGTKLMSFIERRQINLNSDGSNLDKRSI